MEWETVTTIQIGSPAPIHHALDKLTAAIIELQQLQRRLSQGEPPSSALVSDSLTVIEERLHDLSGMLTALRDQSQP
jgi:hypothetical protein